MANGQEDTCPIACALSCVRSKQVPPLTLGELLRTTKIRLSAAGVDNPELDTRYLVGHALNLDRTEMYHQQARILTKLERDEIEKNVRRRADREPVARILGEREFWGLPFGLNEATLEPRSDSETLIEAAMMSLPLNESRRILDLGTGTGCLLLSLLHERPHASGLGIDASARAIDQARSNATNLGLTPRADFQLGNWLDGIEEKFDLIISNPPYIKRSDLSLLMPEVRQHDPALALDGGHDGMDVYRLLTPQLGGFVTTNGKIILEVGQGQAENVAALLHHAGFLKITSHCDLNGIERCLCAAYR
jgi:release factor glutamine methyltransferase